MAILHIGLDNVLYARTVNGIRKYFLHQNTIIDYSSFVLLPTNIKLPEMHKYQGHLFMLILCMALINSALITLGIMQYEISFFNVYVYAFIGLYIFLLHFKLYKVAALWKERTYISNRGVDNE
jgi:uncharacterized membrane protein